MGADFSKWRMSIVETIAIASALVGVTVWVTMTFQSKLDATQHQNAIDTRFSVMQAEITSLNTSTNQIAVDVSYIRGRLEPKPNH